MKKGIGLLLLLTLALLLPPATLMMAQQAGAGRANLMARPEGPCDLYAAGKAPCVAAHSSTRALYAAYNGPLYQVMRQSDGKTLDIGVVPATASDAGGYADAAAQDAFCSNTLCWVTTLYDQSGHGNNLVQPPHGGFSGPAMGGFDNVPIADMAPVTIMGHKAYGIYIAPGMGLRWNDAHGTAVDDQAEGQYWVINGHHYNNGCCFDYGNAETDSRDDGNGTMETTYYGNSTGWYRGSGQGPWVMTDQENNLVGCVNPGSNSKLCADLPSITWRFVTAVAKGEPHHWTSMGGDSQSGELKVMFDGPRVNNTYDPMRKQGAILLGNGGDNSNGSQGTFYEGAMTAAGTFPSDATDQKVQANVVAARYDVQRLSVAPASAAAAPPGLQTFAPGVAQNTLVTFTNTTGAPVQNLKLALNVPAGWTAVVEGAADQARSFADPVAPGASVSATFKVTPGPASFNGDIVGNASWVSGTTPKSETMAQRVRNVSPIKINEFSSTFIELYNSGDSEIDISGWSLTEHATQQAIFSSIKVPAGTKLAAKGFHVLALSNSGLAVGARKGDSTLYVRSVAGMNVGDTIEIGAGSGMETRKITAVGTAAGAQTTLWQPLPDGPVVTLAAGAKNIPVSSVGGGGRGGAPGAPGGQPAPAAGPFAPGQKIAIGYGATFPAVAQAVEKYEVVTVTETGKPGTQAFLAAEAKAGDTNIKFFPVGNAAANISVGDKIRLGYDSLDHGVEWVTVKSVGTPAAFNPNNVRTGNAGTGLELAEPLKFAHSANMPFSVRGTGISFEPATAYVHASNEPVLALGTGITLDKALDSDHEINDVVRDAAVTDAGYQGEPKPSQWFGGPAIGNAGTMVLRDAAGHVADSLNYGGVIDPWAAEGYQGRSPGNGCSAPGFAGGGRGGRGGAPAPTGPRSTARTTDGMDSDSNCADFQALAPTPGASNKAPQ